MVGLTFGVINHYICFLLHCMARDKLHYNAREALIKDGWSITADPLRIRIDGSYLEVDLSAEKVFAAERAGKCSRGEKLLE
ncbi:element excision factor XisH family protein [Haliscomenobacter sp.]|uniref:element excision factor XisH family protein n=1 Tax=Haliscomenobacter sp. TaxID=2717303 RepID=UPI0039B6F0B9